MDRALVAFRSAAAAENRERSGLRRRYSTAARQRAIAYWQQQRGHGVRVRRIAAALGVAQWSLHRWIRAVTADFRPVTVVATDATRPAGSTLTMRITADGPQVDGLDVESAARLLRLLR